MGIWVSLVCGVVFIAAYTNRVAHEARQLADALTATELALSRHEQLSALDGLAAAAAHELGTPLSTIALAAKEMKADIPPGPLADDVDLIIAQSARCRAILAKLRSLRSGEVGDPFAALPVGELLEEVAKPLEGLRQIHLHRGARDAEGEPVFKRSAGLLYGLGNLIENATQFAKTRVDVDAAWDRDAITVTIADDGPGFAEDLIARLGEPYLTTRARNTAPEGDAPGGLGLGIFIAKTLLERTGATLAFANSKDGGARVTITWPRSARVRRLAGILGSERLNEQQMSTVDELLAADRTLLLVDDDKAFLTRLERAMEKRGFEVRSADTVAAGLSAVEAAPPAFAVVDLRLEDGNGLDVVDALHKKRPDARAVVLTGYGNIATAVTAVKLGAVDYLSKPADADDVINALLATGEAGRRRRPKTRCRPIASAGSTSSASTSCATATSPRPRGGSTCTAAPCSASSPSARRSKSEWRVANSE